MNISFERKFIASIERVSDKDQEPQEPSEVQIVYSPALKTRDPNDIFVSEACARVMGLKDGDSVRIKEIYEDPSTINLDNY
jgi:hypothetical protein